MPPRKAKKSSDDNWMWLTDVTNVADISDDHLASAYGGGGLLLIGNCTAAASSSSAAAVAPSTSKNDATTNFTTDKNNATPNSNNNNCRSTIFDVNMKPFQQWIDGYMDWSDDEEEESTEMRSKGSFVGLMNLGATCYVNTFLQLWYHNIAFRNAVFDWSEDPGNASPVFSTLQYIFGLLELSERSCIDPTPLIETLGLDHHMQQDAQEFSKLFIELLDSQAIKNLFSGSYNYVTKCSSCKTESKRPSTFYELDLNIEGMSRLEQSISEFLKEENLDGDNQYFCSNCKAKQDATRRIVLQNLPPVLNIQLLRFVFDRKTGQKKKLSTNIQFPDKLELGCVSGDGTGDLSYELVAVLHHNGATASSGHYTAHIHKGDNWWRFNDGNVEKLKGRKLNLTSDDADCLDIGTQPEGRISKVQKGYNSTRGAYMLVYHKTSFKESLADVQLSPVPEDIVNRVKEDNETLIYLSEAEDMRKTEEIMRIEMKKELITTLYEKLAIEEETDNFLFIPEAWLDKILADQSDIECIDSQPILCKHNKLNILAMSKVKVVSQKTKHLLKQFAGEKTVWLSRSDGLCLDCVANQFKLRKKRAEVETDIQTITECMSDEYSDTQTHFWVSKADFRKWKGMIIKPLEQEAAVVLKNNSGESTQNGFESLSQFNDIECYHGNLIIEDKQRQLVPSVVWQILKKHFPGAIEFPNGSEPCLKCLDEVEQENAYEKQQMDILKEEKRLLQTLAQNENRPNLSELTVEKVYCIPEHSYKAWKIFLKSPHSEDAIQSIANSSLICSHDRLTVDPADTSSVVLLWPFEWDILSSHFPCDTVISVSPVPVYNKKKELILSLTDIKTTVLNGNGSIHHEVVPDNSFQESLLNNHNVKPYIVTPEICRECMAERKRANEIASHYFSRADIYVRLLDDTTNDQSSPRSKKARLEVEDNPASRRRSERRRRVRGEKCVKLSSDATLKELKVELVKLFAIAPFDQTLSVDGKILEGDDQSLAELKLYPECIVCVQTEAADENRSEQMELDNPAEEGFRGTGLMGSSHT